MYRACKIFFARATPPGRGIFDFLVEYRVCILIHAFVVTISGQRDGGDLQAPFFHNQSE